MNVALQQYVKNTAILRFKKMKVNGLGDYKIGRVVQ